MKDYPAKYFQHKEKQNSGKKIKKPGIKSNGYYHYDKEYIKINKEVHV